MRRVSIALILSTILLVSDIYSASAADKAASKYDQALALAASGCLMGWLNLPWVLSENMANLAVGTAISSQWSEKINTEYVQIHHNQYMEGWNSASFLDSRWKKLSQTYEQLYSFVSAQIKAGKVFGNILDLALKKYGGVLNSNCKIAVSSAKAKAKAQSLTLPTWVIKNAGELLPPLDSRSAR